MTAPGQVDHVTLCTNIIHYIVYTEHHHIIPLTSTCDMLSLGDPIV